MNSMRTCKDTFRILKKYLKGLTNKPTNYVIESFVLESGDKVYHVHASSRIEDTVIITNYDVKDGELLEERRRRLATLFWRNRRLT